MKQNHRKVIKKDTSVDKKFNIDRSKSVNSLNQFNSYAASKKTTTSSRNIEISNSYYMTPKSQTKNQFKPKQSSVSNLKSPLKHGNTSQILENFNGKIDLHIKSLEFPQYNVYFQKYLNQKDSKIKFEFCLYGVGKGFEQILLQETEELSTHEIINQQKNSVQLNFEKILEMDPKKVSKSSIYLTIKSKLKFPGKTHFKDYQISCAEIQLFKCFQKQSAKQQVRKLQLPCATADQYMYVPDFIIDSINKDEKILDNSPVLHIQLKYQTYQLNDLYHINTDTPQSPRRQFKLPKINKQKTQNSKKSVQNTDRYKKASNNDSLQIENSILLDQEGNSVLKRSQNTNKSISQSSQRSESHDNFDPKPLPQSNNNRQSFNYRQSFVHSLRQIEKQKADKQAAISDSQIMVKMVSLQNLDGKFVKGSNFQLKIQVLEGNEVYVNPVNWTPCQITYQIKSLYEDKMMKIDHQFFMENFIKDLKNLGKNFHKEKYYIYFQLKGYDGNEKISLDYKIPFFNMLGNMNTGNFFKHFCQFQKKVKRTFNGKYWNLAYFDTKSQQQVFSPIILNFTIQHPGQQELDNCIDVFAPPQQKRQKKTNYFIQNYTILHHKNVEVNEIKPSPIERPKEPIQIKEETETEKAEENPENGEEKKEKNGDIMLYIDRVEDFDESKGGLAIDFCLVGKQGIIMDRNKKPLNFGNENIYDGDSSDNIVELYEKFPMKIKEEELKKQYPDEYHLIRLFFHFSVVPMDEEQDEMEYGWSEFPIFDEFSKELKMGDSVCPLYAPPLVKLKDQDKSKVKKTPSIMYFKIDKESS